MHREAADPPFNSVGLIESVRTSRESMSIATSQTTRATRVEVTRRVQFADAALAVAGHEVTDSALRDLTHRVAAGELTAEEAVRQGTARIDAR